MGYDKRPLDILHTVTLFQTTMKLLLIAVILSVLVFTEARPDNIDYQLLDNFSSCMKAAFGQQPQHIMKSFKTTPNFLQIFFPISYKYFSIHLEYPVSYHSIHKLYHSLTSLCTLFILSHLRNAII